MGLDRRPLLSGSAALGSAMLLGCKPADSTASDSGLTAEDASFEYHSFPGSPPGDEPISDETRDGAEMYEVGNVSNIARAAQREALKYILKLGVDNILAHAKPMCNKLIAELPGLGYPCITPPGNPTPITAFLVEKPGETTARLHKANVVAKIWLKQMRGHARSDQGAGCAGASGPGSTAVPISSFSGSGRPPLHAAGASSQSFESTSLAAPTLPPPPSRGRASWAPRPSSTARGWRSWPRAPRCTALRVD
jgi:hypothetical protein